MPIRQIGTESTVVVFHDARPVPQKIREGTTRLPTLRVSLLSWSVPRSQWNLHRCDREASRSGYYSCIPNCALLSPVSGHPKQGNVPGGAGACVVEKDRHWWMQVFAWFRAVNCRHQREAAVMPGGSIGWPALQPVVNRALLLKIIPG